MGDFIGNGASGATFSDCRSYRYTLWRRWHADCEPSEMVAFVGLNPSKADETEDDPTIRRCIGFAKKWGASGMVMVNLFAFRATDPKVMKAASSPIGPLNDEALRIISVLTACTVCAWGKHGKHLYRGGIVRLMLKHEAKRSLYHLGLNGDGSPKHPLYLPAEAERIRW